jgi:hypothetical protein
LDEMSCAVWPVMSSSTLVATSTSGMSFRGILAKPSRPRRVNRCAPFQTLHVRLASPPIKPAPLSLVQISSPPFHHETHTPHTQISLRV